MQYRADHIAEDRQVRADNKAERSRSSRAVQNGVGQSGIADYLVPAIDRDSAGDQQGPAIVNEIGGRVNADALPVEPHVFHA